MTAKSPHEPLQGERGAALVAAIFLLGMVFILLVGITRLTIASFRTTDRALLRASAERALDAGLDCARARLRRGDAAGFTMQRECAGHACRIVSKSVSEDTCEIRVCFVGANASPIGLTARLRRAPPGSSDRISWQVIEYHQGTSNYCVIPAKAGIQKRGSAAPGFPPARE